jgi:hypothetical protein
MSGGPKGPVRYQRDAVSRCLKALGSGCGGTSDTLGWLAAAGLTRDPFPASESESPMTVLLRDEGGSVRIDIPTYQVRRFPVLVRAYLEIR